MGTPSARSVWIAVWRIHSDKKNKIESRPTNSTFTTKSLLKSREQSILLEKWIRVETRFSREVD